MLQHILLILAAAPLLALSGFPIAAFSALPRKWAASLGRQMGRQSKAGRLWRWLTQPGPAWGIFLVGLWAWHTPGLFEAALENDSIHALEHFSLLLAGVLFWWALFQPGRDRVGRLGIAIPTLFTTGLHMSLLGALFTLAGHPLYPVYALEQSASGLDALQDQQLAGLIMWVPGGLLFTLLSAWFFLAWFKALEDRAARQDSLIGGNRPGEEGAGYLSKEDYS